MIKYCQLLRIYNKALNTKNIKVLNKMMYYCHKYNFSYYDIITDYNKIKNDD